MTSRTEVRATSTVEILCSGRARWWIAGAALAAAALSLLPLRPPSVEAVEERVGFSTERAFADVATIAAAPRPLGSPEHARVRRLIVDRLTAAGLPAEVEEAVVVSPRDGDSADVYRVSNVTARLDGRGGGEPVLLVAHYDSVPAGPGAADNAAGVATLLETGRLLAAGPPLRNDVTLLFTDGEEEGLSGARGWVEGLGGQPPAGIALNFEARGVRGPSILFETAGAGLPLMRRYAAEAPYPLATSISYDVYRLLPNDTDFTPLRRAGMSGLNFAFIDGVTGYHSRLDDVSRLDPRSVAHHGSNAVSLARYFGDAELASFRGEAPAVYFNLPLAGLLVYSGGWSLPLALLAFAAALAAAVLAVVRGRSRAASVALAVAVPPAAVLAAAVAAFVVHSLIGLLGPSPAELRGAGLHPVALTAVVAVVVWALSFAVSRRLDLAALAAGTAVVWALLAAVVCLVLPSSAYLFIWPGLVLAVGLCAAFTARRGLCASLAVAAAATVVLWVPTLVLLATAASPSAVWLVAVAASLPLAGSTPQIAALSPRRGGRWAPALGAAAVLLLLAALPLGAGFGPDRPRQNSLIYLLDTEHGDATWLTFDRSADGWTSAVLGEEGEVRRVQDVFEGDEREMLGAEAPRVDLAPPTVEVVAQVVLPDGGRRLRLAARSPRGAAVMRLALRSEATLPRLVVSGRMVPAQDADGERSVVVWGVGDHSVDLVVDVAAGAELRVTAVDIAYGLPAAGNLEPRGPGFAPRSDAPSDVTLVRSVHDV